MVVQFLTESERLELLEKFIIEKFPGYASILDQADVDACFGKTTDDEPEEEKPCRLDFSKGFDL